MPQKITITVCVGTTCHLFGASDVLEVTEHLPVDKKECVEIRGESCFGICKDAKRTLGNPPFVKVNNEIISAATIEKVVAACEKQWERE